MGRLHNPLVRRFGDLVAFTDHFLLQIVCILARLIDKDDLLTYLLKKGFGSAKNFAFRLLETTRNAALTPQDYQQTLDARIQIHFHPP